jgi:hypothetical protein
VSDYWCAALIDGVQPSIIKSRLLLKRLPRRIACSSVVWKAAAGVATIRHFNQEKNREQSRYIDEQQQRTTF